MIEPNPEEKIWTPTLILSICPHIYLLFWTKNAADDWNSAPIEIGRYSQYLWKVVYISSWWSFSELNYLNFRQKRS